MQSDTGECQPPAHEGCEGHARQIRERLYVLTNKKARTTLNLCSGRADPGTSIIGYEQQIERDNANQMWLIRREGLNDTYTLRSLVGGTYMALRGGSPNDGTPTLGWPREWSPLARADQEWRVEEQQ
ncbi:hypothetical protein FRC05_002931, partial [Tulasnella sp. 425]